MREGRTRMRETGKYHTGTPDYPIRLYLVQNTLRVALALDVFDAGDEYLEVSGAAFGRARRRREDVRFVLWVADQGCEVPGSREDFGREVERYFAVAAEEEDARGGGGHFLGMGG
ncbi:hypothetical protein QC760_007182 [Botrytis cinerea]